MTGYSIPHSGMEPLNTTTLLLLLLHSNTRAAPLPANIPTHSFLVENYISTETNTQEDSPNISIGLDMANTTAWMTCTGRVTWSSVETNLKELPAGLSSLSLAACPLPETPLSRLLQEPGSLTHLTIASSPRPGMKCCSVVWFGVNKP